MRKAVFGFLVLLIAIPVVAQQAPRPPQQGQQGPPPDAVLREVLQLDDAQLAAIKGLEDKRRSTVEPLMPQLGAAQQAVGAALNADNPDALTVGKAMLAVRDIQKQIDAAQKAFADGFAALLNDTQKQQLEHIHGVEAALRAGQALHAIGL